MTIEKFIYKFNVDGNKVEISIECNKGFWRAESLKRDWGSSGGTYKSLNDYISHVEMAYSYSYNFHNNGYKYAKENL